MSISKFNKPIYIYIHLASINNYKDVFNNLLVYIKKSGLYDIVSEIRCCTLGEYDINIFSDPKIILRFSSQDLSLYESITINKLLEDSKKEDFYCLYLHTKGVTKPGHIFVESWVEYMCHFNINCYAQCIDLLKTCDTVGVNLQDRENEKCHYPGNFWWSKSKYIKKKSVCTNDYYYNPEFWLTKDKNGKYTSLWHSNCGHYGELYEKEKYVGKPITPYTFDYTSLDNLSRKYHLDKNIASGCHNYIPSYVSLFEDIRYHVKNFLEICIGTVGNATISGFRTGNSLKCWSEYFPNAKIYGLDVHEDKALNTEDITVFIGNQNNEKDLQNLVTNINCKLDIIIDDGDHIIQDQINSFIYLNKYLSKKGIYIIEDIQPPYIDKFKDLTIFPDEYINYIHENFDYKYFDTRDNSSRQDDFIACFIRK